MKGPRALGALALVVSLSALLTLGALPAAAPAVIVQVAGRTLSFQPIHPGGASQANPQAKSGQPLLYHGGRVMTSNTNYAFYWDPAGGPEFPGGYQTGLNRYFEDVAHDSGAKKTIDSVLAQYTQNGTEPAAYSSAFGGALLDTNAYPANGCASAPICLTDAQLRSELTAYVQAHGLPSDLSHAYFIITPPGVESCSDAEGHKCSDGASHPTYCAYHGAIESGSSVIVYAHDPYVDGTGCDVGEEHPNGNPSDATIGGGLAHEHAEMVTDPTLKAWYDAKGNEVADKCRTLKATTEFGPPLGQAPNGSNYNQVINSDLYWYQQVWSNAEEACEQRAAVLPVVTKLSPKAGPSSGGTAVKITGTGFSAPATVKFGSTSATSVTVNSSTSITAVSPPGTKGTVDVTVTTAAGTSGIVKKDHFKYKK